MESIAPALLAWYDQNKRVLPFRTLSTPYRVWVSEIMLQQTRVAAALPYFERFRDALPTVADLAACPPDKLAKLWEGLGYYSRARNLQKAAQKVMAEYGGQLPGDPKELEKLPGIGPYTAGAIASISFGKPVPAVDGNVLRVASRLFLDEGDVMSPPVRARLTEAIQAMQPADRPGDYNQALMELGALVCAPGGPPLCHVCPLADRCAAKAAGRQTELPVKAAPKPRRTVDYTVVLAVADGAVLLNRRPAKGLLAGLWQPLLLEGVQDEAAVADALRDLGLTPGTPRPVGTAKHVFSHLEWHMTGYLVPVDPARAPEGHVWADRAMLEGVYAVPGAFRALMDVLKKCL